jgi:hypothetical protein
MDSELLPEDDKVADSALVHKQDEFRSMTGFVSPSLRITDATRI